MNILKLRLCVWSSMTRRIHILLVLLSFLIFISLISPLQRSPLCISTGWAEKIESMQKRLSREQTVRNQKLMRGQRFVLGLSLGSSLGDTYVRNFPLGVHAQYFLSDQVGIGAYGFFALNSETALSEQIRVQRPQRVTPTSLSNIGLGAGAFLNYTPIHGKFSLLSVSTLRYDIGFTGGVGLLNQSLGGVSAFKIAPEVGVETNFFISESLAMSLFYKLYIYSHADHQVIVSGVPQAEEAWAPHHFGGVKINFFFGTVKVSR